LPDEEPIGEKTEEPTPKRLEKAREEGQVAKSQEFGAAFTLLASFLTLYFLFGSMMHSLQNRVTSYLTLSEIPEMSEGAGYYELMDNIVYIADLVAPIMIASAVVGGIVNFLQVGPMLNAKIIQPDFTKLDPIKGLKNLFSLKSLFELVKSILKAVVITAIAYNQVRQRWTALISLSHQGLEPGLLLVADLIVTIAIQVLIFLVILGVADLLYQRWEHHKNLMMTKQEVKEERKEMEGDPEIRQKRRQKQREMSVNRMMSSMKEADVVITNPTHIAVALKYEMEEMEAPLVIAKGEGHLARRIKERAKELEIPIVENKSLAQALNKMAEIGQEIPVDLYQVVAEVLAYVYQQEKRQNY